MDGSVFINILNWNGWEDTIECIESCQLLQYPNFQIVVIDNGSEDDSVAILRSRFPQIILIETGVNLGFAGGNNIGINYAIEQGADYIWLLNNDTIVMPSALSELIIVAEGDSQIGMVGSKVMQYANRELIDFVLGSVDLQVGRTKHIGRGEKDTGQYDLASESDYITGCSLLVKKAVIAEIGLMTEEYFLYYEETDWCLQARKKGYKIYNAPLSTIYHKVHSSTQKVPGAFVYYITRNRLYFLEKFGENIKWKKRIMEDWSIIKAIFSAKFLSAKFFTKISKLPYLFKAYFHWFFGMAGAMKSPVKYHANIWKRCFGGQTDHRAG